MALFWKKKRNGRNAGSHDTHEVYPVSDAGAALGRYKFERIYDAAREADGEGDTESSLVNCRAALELLHEEDLYGDRQASVEIILRRRIHTIEQRQD